LYEFLFGVVGGDLQPVKGEVVDDHIFLADDGRWYVVRPFGRTLTVADSEGEVALSDQVWEDPTGSLLVLIR